jgi:hypothetical protein
LVVPATSTNTSANGTSGIYLWGAQLEAGAFPTSYIPTTTATVTRSADVASISGSNFSSWFNANEGTLYSESRVAQVSVANAVTVSLNDNTTTNRIQVNRTTSSFNTFSVSGGNTQSDITIPGVSSIANTTEAQADAYKLNSCNSAAKGVLGTEDTSALVPTVSQMNIGQRNGGNLPINGTIRRLTYWPRRLGNEVLQSITQ